eukprot:2594593-Pyramimonas_sp.AAC.1
MHRCSDAPPDWPLCNAAEADTALRVYHNVFRAAYASGDYEQYVAASETLAAVPGGASVAAALLPGAKIIVMVGRQPA